MSIPGAADANVSQEKLTSYLLNLTHPIGGSKARWFYSLGYSAHDPEQLSTDLRLALMCGTVLEVKSNAYGVKYVVSGQMLTPSGIEARVMTVWIVTGDHPAPRLVTAFPAKEDEHERI